MSMSLGQQQAMVEAMENLEKHLAHATMSHRVCMVMAEALRQKLCMSRLEVEKLMDEFARENAASIRDELALEYKDGVFTPAGVSAPIDPERN